MENMNAVEAMLWLFDRRAPEGTERTAKSFSRFAYELDDEMVVRNFEDADRSSVISELLQLRDRVVNMVRAKIKQEDVDEKKSEHIPLFLTFRGRQVFLEGKEGDTEAESKQLVQIFWEWLGDLTLDHTFSDGFHPLKNVEWKQKDDYNAAADDK